MFCSIEELKSEHALQERRWKLAQRQLKAIDTLISGIKRDLNEVNEFWDEESCNELYDLIHHLSHYADNVARPHYQESLEAVTEAQINFERALFSRPAFME